MASATSSPHLEIIPIQKSGATLTHPYNGPENPQANQQPQVVYVQQKKKGGCLKWGAIIIGALLLLGLITNLAGGNKEDGSSTSTDQQSSQTADKKQADKPPVKSTEPLNVGEAFTTKKKLDITVNSFAAQSSPFGTQLSCANVTYTNNGDGEVSFQGYWDWKQQNPAGVITNPTFSGGESLQSGKLAPGGTVSGDVCFEGTAPGEYKLNFEPSLSFSNEKASWRGNL
ncbi:DUF4352 domain-containing protein [Corynebacterium sp. H128]|uniref:DUF4352 domain-containing protein n=1 Tax=Corynebacterium sp. H128 TaxID=3133427 RepID=UPI0030A97AAC